MQTAELIKLIIADDHYVIRLGLRKLLETELRFRIVGEAADGLEAMDQVEKLRPDVLLLDLRMPGFGGIEVTRVLTARFPSTRILILSMHADRATVSDAFRWGAAGFCTKDTPAEDMILGIKQIACGRRYLSPGLSQLAVEAYIQVTTARIDRGYGELSTRDRQMLRMRAEGQGTALIAKHLSLSERVVESNCSGLMRRLALKSQTDLIRFALKQGIIL